MTLSKLIYSDKNKCEYIQMRLINFLLFLNYYLQA